MTKRLYINTLKSIQRVHTLRAVAVQQWHRQSPQGPPLQLWHQRRRGQRSNLAGGVRWHCGYHFCGGCKGDVVPVLGKTPPCRVGQKRFPGIYSTAPCFAGNSWTSAGLKMRPAWRQVHCRGQPAWPPHRHWPVGPGGVGRPARPHRLCRLEMAGGDNLLPVPDPDCEGARHAVENRVWAVVGPLQGWDNPSVGGLLDRSTARYFYKVPKTILHKPTAKSGINIFYNKCLHKHYLQLL